MVVGMLCAGAARTALCGGLHAWSIGDGPRLAATPAGALPQGRDRPRKADDDDGIEIGDVYLGEGGRGGARGGGFKERKESASAKGAVRCKGGGGGEGHAGESRANRARQGAL
eukprot:scaffold3607_cov114-Isochrysis_galbana.AAC.2